MKKRGLPVYTISVAARLTELPIHTIRWLEANRFIQPSRTDGNQRLFRDEDIELLQEIAALLERRVNLAGIRTILHIKRTYRITRIHIKEE
jgi:MerR family glutamine synthetase transcriptional repressor